MPGDPFHPTSDDIKANEAAARGDAIGYYYHTTRSESTAPRITSSGPFKPISVFGWLLLAAAILIAIWAIVDVQPDKPRKGKSSPTDWTADDAFKSSKPRATAGGSGPPAIGKYRVSGSRADGTAYGGTLALSMTPENRYQLVWNGGQSIQLEGGWNGEQIVVFGPTEQVPGGGTRFPYLVRLRPAEGTAMNVLWADGSRERLTFSP